MNGAELLHSLTTPATVFVVCNRNRRALWLPEVVKPLVTHGLLRCCSVCEHGDDLSDALVGCGSYTRNYNFAQGFADTLRTMDSDCRQVLVLGSGHVRTFQAQGGMTGFANLTVVVPISFDEVQLFQKELSGAGSICVGTTPVPHKNLDMLAAIVGANTDMFVEGETSELHAFTPTSYARVANFASRRTNVPQTLAVPTLSPFTCLTGSADVVSRAWSSFARRMGTAWSYVAGGKPEPESTPAPAPEAEATTEGAAPAKKQQQLFRELHAAVARVESNAAAKTSAQDEDKLPLAPATNALIREVADEVMRKK